PPDSSNGATTQPEPEAPVATDPEPPIQYPPALYDRKVAGDVVVRLFVDSTGRVVTDSQIEIEVSSGYPAMDTAALAGVTALTYDPAKRRGIPVATWFLQPIQFRHPDEPVIRGDQP
ncbi:MAG: energy transducer TonB, partial [Gemmatimonadales bacterium]